MAFTYEDAERYVLELPLHTKKNPFEATKAFYEWLGEPGSGCPTIHIAGTNGKGSVCAYLNSMLSVARYRVGMFTSPHLMELRERLVLGNAQIEKAQFLRLFHLLQEKLGQYGKEYHPAFFEFLFFLFLLWMEEEKPDCILLETGMGGRLDATNVIAHPAVTVITRIGLDHCAYLGDTTELIAREKVCIFKENIPAVCLETEDAVTRVFVEKAQNLHAPLVMVSKNEVAFSKIKKNYIDFFLRSAYDKDIEARLETIAIYQVENAALAVRALEQLHALFPISTEQMERGLSGMRWPARMEDVVPGIWLDGAHNPDGIRAFLESVGQDGFQGERWLLFGACADKSAREMGCMIQCSGLFTRVAATVIDSARSLSEAALRELFSGEQRELSPGEQREQVPVFGDVADALAHLIRQRGGQVRIYIAGSLYLAGEVKRYLEDTARSV